MTRDELVTAGKLLDNAVLRPSMLELGDHGILREWAEDGLVHAFEDGSFCLMRHARLAWWQERERSVS